MSLPREPCDWEKQHFLHSLNQSSRGSYPLMNQTWPWSYRKPNSLFS